MERLAPSSIYAAVTSTMMFLANIQPPGTSPTQLFKINCREGSSSVLLIISDNGMLYQER
jgi:hypothetical protein